MAKLGEMAARDGLTNLFNRRYFDEALNCELSRAVRSKSSLSLCMMDIDHFKKVNDTYGHTTGDAVLKQVSKIITDTVRRYDIACRNGGEEFGIILPETSRPDAKNVCNRIRINVEKHLFESHSFSFNITLSAGVTILDKVVPDDLESSEIILTRADQALYEAKEGGRNRVVCD